ncbi:hypothetical protein QUB77_00955 [Microcoleus sp. AT9b-C3]
MQFSTFWSDRALQLANKLYTLTCNLSTRMRVKSDDRPFLVVGAIDFHNRQVYFSPATATAKFLSGRKF